MTDLYKVSVLSNKDLEINYSDDISQINLPSYDLMEEDE